MLEPPLLARGSHDRSKRSVGFQLEARRGWRDFIGAAPWMSTASPGVASSRHGLERRGQASTRIGVRQPDCGVRIQFLSRALGYR